ncbi:hypothetical protein [Hymenobacter elongatus]|uniref:hypothetical protein n=1 Tax=Hymenobacter elongatus TaxID=877208 RepID=UPI001AEC044F|nr:hypothetical protein [Hymenobacter elongatus]
MQKTITTFFDGMRRGDSTLVRSTLVRSTLVRSTLAPGVVFQTITTTKEGTTRVGLENPNGFLKSVGTPHKEVYDERIRFERVLLDANLASVWTPYQFYVGPKFSHCGYNSFQLVKYAQGWRIVHVIDTRRQDGCQ